jgi:hypothetical protein
MGEKRPPHNLKSISLVDDLAEAPADDSAEEPEFGGEALSLIGELTRLGFFTERFGACLLVDFEALSLIGAMTRLGFFTERLGAFSLVDFGEGETLSLIELARLGFFDECFDSCFSGSALDCLGRLPCLAGDRVSSPSRDTPATKVPAVPPGPGAADAAGGGSEGTGTSWRVSAWAGRTQLLGPSASAATAALLRHRPQARPWGGRPSGARRAGPVARGP